MFFDKRFFEVTDTQKLNEIYDISFEKLGDVESYDIEKWETQAIVGTDPKTNYVFILNVKRSNYASKETVMLLKEKDEVKIRACLSLFPDEYTMRRQLKANAERDAFLYGTPLPRVVGEVHNPFSNIYSLYGGGNPFASSIGGAGGGSSGGAGGGGTSNVGSVLSMN
uniref:DM10 domain-containing protein n=1 Tax=Parastrongyloides trichosuri TaxID=131310 RepID=A0A0N4ZEB5_PARTI